MYKVVWKHAKSQKTAHKIIFVSLLVSQQTKEENETNETQIFDCNFFPIFSHQPNIGEKNSTRYVEV